MLNQESSRKSEVGYQQYIPQTKALAPSVYTLDVCKTPNKGMMKAQKRILKDVKKKHNSFMVGRRKIQEIDKSLVEKVQDNGLVPGYSLNQRSDSRQSTPNPWKEHESRQKQHKIIS